MNGIITLGGYSVARINIEDKLYRDERFLELIRQSGSTEMALGIMIRIWTVAQEFWKNGKRPIPAEAYAKQRLSPLAVASGLVIENGDYYHVAGSEEQFAWLTQKQEAGKKGGKKRALKSLKNRSSAAKPRLTEESEAKPLTLTPSLTLTLTQTHESPPEGSVSQGDCPDEIKNPVGYFIGTYAKAYKARYGEKARPALVGKVQGQIKQFLKDVPLDRACQMIETFCAMDDPWFKTKGHDFGTFMENLTKVGLAIDTGQGSKKEGWLEQMVRLEKEGKLNEVR